MRIVLDTNILIAAVITRDTPPDRLYRAWLRGDVRVITCPQQIEELARVLARPHMQKFLDRDEAHAIAVNLDTRATVIRDAPPVHLSPDPDDNPILAAAIAGKAGMIVTGDKRHMLHLGDAAGIPIVTAREALRVLAEGE